MNTRREFLSSALACSLGGLVREASASIDEPVVPIQEARSYWLAVLEKLARPILENLSQRRLRKTMPVEAANPADRAKYTHLEALGRLLAGIAPWLGATGLDQSEGTRQRHLLDLTHVSLDAATDPNSPDFMNFSQGNQPLVDAAFLAQGILRARDVLWNRLDQRVKCQLVDALKSSRAIPTPDRNNWVMFAATVEAALHVFGEQTIEDRLERCVERMLSWYKGDSVYGDGEFFHFDYYNSFVIHPMLVDVLAVLQKKDANYASRYQTELQRARRYAEIQERLIAPDGTYPAVGRSITYRFGAFHALAQMAWMHELPERVTPAQVRCALTAVIRKQIEAPGTFDEKGWLRIGFAGYQPTLAESYISTGSLYLCATALLPLGLAPSDPFWNSADAPWTSQQIWSGKSLPADHALSEHS
jgi:hypothetical protein